MSVRKIFQSVTTEIVRFHVLFPTKNIEFQIFDAVARRDS